MRDVTRHKHGLEDTWGMAEDLYLSCEESDYRSDCTDSLDSSKSDSELSLLCFRCLKAAILDLKWRTVRL